MVAIIQNSVADTFIEPKLELIEKIREETLQEIEKFFGNLNIEFGDLLKFFKNPVIYPGKIIGLKQIAEKNLYDIISKHCKEIQAEGLPIKFVIDNVRKNLFQGSWSVKKNQNIAMANRGRDDTREALSTSRIDEPPRLLPIKNKVHKVKSKPKPKKRVKRGPKVKTIKKGKIGKPNQCDYCGSYIKIRKTHINICQNPTHHQFCSKECKISWIFGLNEINEKISQED